MCSIQGAVFFGRFDVFMGGGDVRICVTELLKPNLIFLQSLSPLNSFSAFEASGINALF